MPYTYIKYMYFKGHCVVLRAFASVIFDGWINNDIVLSNKLINRIKYSYLKLTFFSIIHFEI